eukprot:2903996-Pyramimonas_sp.AAC.1
MGRPEHMGSDVCSGGFGARSSPVGLGARASGISGALNKDVRCQGPSGPSCSTCAALPLRAYSSACSHSCCIR